jgi:hypothetical protein
MPPPTPPVHCLLAVDACPHGWGSLSSWLAEPSATFWPHVLPRRCRWLHTSTPRNRLPKRGLRPNPWPLRHPPCNTMHLSRRPSSRSRPLAMSRNRPGLPFRQSQGTPHPSLSRCRPARLRSQMFLPAPTRREWWLRRRFAREPSGEDRRERGVGKRRELRTRVRGPRNPVTHGRRSQREWYEASCSPFVS